MRKKRKERSRSEVEWRKCVPRVYTASPLCIQERDCFIFRALWCVFRTKPSASLQAGDAGPPLCAGPLRRMNEGRCRTPLRCVDAGWGPVWAGPVWPPFLLCTDTEPLQKQTHHFRVEESLRRFKSAHSKISSEGEMRVNEVRLMPLHKIAQQ